MNYWSWFWTLDKKSRLHPPHGLNTIVNLTSNIPKWRGKNLLTCCCENLCVKLSTDAKYTNDWPQNTNSCFGRPSWLSCPTTSGFGNRWIKHSTNLFVSSYIFLMITYIIIYTPKTKTHPRLTCKPPQITKKQTRLELPIRWLLIGRGDPRSRSGADSDWPARSNI